MVFRNNRLWKISLWDPLRDQLVHQHICSLLQSQELGTHELVPYIIVLLLHCIYLL